ncbi:MAG: hypothetical protein IT324_09980 [Anaerolineae bacterium]|nr:hypothetical protein [Anaerolineae bacterium]
MAEPKPDKQLLRYIARWDRRLRLTQMTLWIPRGLIAGLAIGVAIALISRLRPWLLPPQILAVTGIVALVSVALAVVAIWVWPRPVIKAARYFDRVFDLKERSSTALELMSKSIDAPAALVDLQVRDTVNRAEKVQARRYLPLQWRRRELAGIVGLAVIFALSLLLANPQTAVLAQQQAVQTAVQQQVQKLEQIKQTIQNNPSLTDAQKAEMSQVVDDTIDKLKQPNISKPEAVAALSQAAQKLNSAAQQLTPQQKAAAQEAGQALGQAQTTQGVGQALQNGKLGEAASQLQNLGQRVGNGQMTQQQMQDAANALEQAAQAMQNVNKAAADAMQRAADAMRAGNNEAAQKALQEAAQALAEQQQQMNQSPQSQAAQNAAQQVNSGQQQVAQAGQQPQLQQGQQGQQQQGQQGQQQQGQQGQQQQGQQGQQQQGQQGQQQQGQQGQQQQGQQGQQQQGQGDQSQQGAQGQDQQGQQQNGQGQGQDGQGQQQGQQGGQGGAQEGAGQVAEQGGQPNPGTSQQQGSQQNGFGAGQGEGGAGKDVTQGNPRNSGPIDPNNGHSDGKVAPYEPVYAPSFAGGEGGQKLNPQSDAQRNPNDPTIQGENASNPGGASTVPLNAVAGQAAAQADKAMDADHIPGALRGVIRDYFTGLQSK